MEAVRLHQMAMNLVDMVHGFEQSVANHRWAESAAMAANMIRLLAQAAICLGALDSMAVKGIRDAAKEITALETDEEAAAHLSGKGEVGTEAPPRGRPMPSGRKSQPKEEGLAEGKENAK